MRREPFGVPALALGAVLVALAAQPISRLSGGLRVLCLTLLVLVALGLLDGERP